MSVLITGATSGIGLATAKAFSAKGEDVIAVGRNEEKLKSLELEYLVCDLSSPEDVQNLCGELQKLSNIKTLVNNAGIIERKSALDHSTLDWSQQFQVNLFASVEITKACFTALKSNSPSQVINVSSTLGMRPIAGCAAYNASKAAMNSWTQSSALEWAEYGISVNSVCPGIVDTPIHGEAPSDVKTQMDQAHPLGRMGRPEEIAQYILYLSQQRWTTGQVAPIDGGISLL